MPYLWFHEELLKLSVFYDAQCAHFPSGPAAWRLALVAGSLVPWAVLMLGLWLAAYQRSVTHDALGLGLLLTSLLVGAVAATDVNGAVLDPTCSRRTAGRPSDPIAWMAFVAAWWIVSQIHVARPRHWVRGGLMLGCLGFGCFAQVELRQWSSAEAQLGAALGTLVGIFIYAVMWMFRLPRQLAAKLNFIP